MKKSWVSALLVASLLGSDAPAFAQASWRSVQRVADGALLSATFEDGSQVQGYFISADDSSIFLVIPNAVATPSHRQTLSEMAATRAGFLENVRRGGTFRIDTTIRITDGIVSIDDEAVATMTAIAAADLVEIRGRVKSKGSVNGAIAGAAGGALLGLMISVHAAFTRCQPNCGGTEALMIAAPIGLPIGFGMLGYSAWRKTTTSVIYRKP